MVGASGATNHVPGGMVGASGASNHVPGDVVGSPECFIVDANIEFHPRAAEPRARVAEGRAGVRCNMERLHAASAAASGPAAEHAVDKICVIQSVPVASLARQFFSHWLPTWLQRSEL